MGNEYSMNVFICGNLNDRIKKNVIFEIFKTKGNKSDSEFKQRDHDFDIYFSWNRPLENYKFYWIGHIFKNGSSPQLFQSICEGIQKMVKQYKDENIKKIDIRRNNVILCFLNDNENSNMIEDLIKTMNENSILIKDNNPIIVTVGGSNVDNDYEKLDFISRLPGGNEKDILRNVHSKLLTIDAYLNERGNIFDNIVYRNLGNFDRITATTCLDILIFGGSRSGKSTFINILSNQLLAREQTYSETCTTKCTEYIIPLEDINDNNDNSDNNNIIQHNNDEINNDQLLQQVLENNNQFKGKLKIIDTPGIIDEKDILKVCNTIEKYISEETEIIQLALFFMKDTTTLNKSKSILNILKKNKIPVFFVNTHCEYNNEIRIEETNFYENIKAFIYNNFSDDARQLLIYKGEDIYNIIRINQKADKEKKIVFGLDVLIEKILHFFLFEKIEPLLTNELKEEQTFFQQKNILLSCLSDLSTDNISFSLHNLLFRKSLTLANVSNYYYEKSIKIVVAITFLCSCSCLIPIPIVDIPIYYSLHYAMVFGILSVFGIKLEKVEIKTIMLTNGTNLGKKYKNENAFIQILNVGVKLLISSFKVGAEASKFVPLFIFISSVPNMIFSTIDTSLLGRNLIKTCDKLPKDQQFFKKELEKFHFILKKIDKIRLRIKNNQEKQNN